MKREEFRTYIFPLTKREENCKKGIHEEWDYYQSLEEKGLRDTSGVYHFPTYRDISRLAIPNTLAPNKSYEFNSAHLDGKVCFTKQTRYFRVPMHTHDYIGINYIYSGQAVIVASGKEYALKSGDSCLMDDGVAHTILPAGTDDIILNIQMDKTFLNGVLLSQLSSGGILTKFLVDSFTEKKEREHFLLFRASDKEKLRTVYEDIYCECLEPGICSDEILASYLNLVLIEMVRSYQGQEAKAVRKKSPAPFLQVLSYINENYQSCTLAETAARFGFSDKYLSRIIKEKTGYSFNQLVAENRMRQVCFMLRHTELSIQDIAEQNGYHNLTHFYNKFKERYEKTPHQFRNDN